MNITLVGPLNSLNVVYKFRKLDYSLTCGQLGQLNDVNYSTGYNTLLQHLINVSSKNALHCLELHSKVVSHYILCVALMCICG